MTEAEAAPEVATEATEGKIVELDTPVAAAGGVGARVLHEGAEGAGGSK